MRSWTTSLQVPFFTAWSYRREIKGYNFIQVRRWHNFVNPFGKTLVFRSVISGASAIGDGCTIIVSFRYAKIRFYIDIGTRASIFSEIPWVFSKRSLLASQVLGAVIRSLCGEALVMCPKGIEKLARVRLPCLIEVFLYHFLSLSHLFNSPGTVEYASRLS